MKSTDRSRFAGIAAAQAPSGHAHFAAPRCGEIELQSDDLGVRNTERDADD